MRRQAKTRISTSDVVVDLRHLHLIGSSAIGALILARKATIDQARTFRVTNVHGLVDRVIRVTGVLEVLTGRTSGPTAV